MNLFSKKWVKITLGIVLILFIFVVGFTIYKKNMSLKDFRQSFSDVEQENQKLKTSLEKCEKDLSEKNEDKPNETSDVNQQSTKEISSSIYNRISTSSAFKSRIVASIRLLEAGDPSAFNVLNGQVNYIYEMSTGGGMQVKRNIYLNPKSTSDDTILASMIVHEASHVYNVYVRKIYSYNTKEQELPCYEAELNTTKKLGAPAYFISFLKTQIVYWQKQ